mgnify:CR=1 FL=1
MGLLSLAIWTPIAFGVVLLALGRDDQAPMVRWIALVGAVVGLAVTVPLYTGFKLGTAALQFVEKAPWIQNFNNGNQNNNWKNNNNRARAVRRVYPFNPLVL